MIQNKKLAIGSDHAGYELKETLKKYLVNNDFDLTDCGTDNDGRCDYADFAHKVAKEVENESVDFGILICGSGNGINMAANKHQAIRSALCWTPKVASLAKEHNDANIIVLPARFVSVEEAQQIIEAYVNAEFEGGRHQNRIEKIACC